MSHPYVSPKLSMETMVSIIRHGLKKTQRLNISLSSAPEWPDLSQRHC